MPRRPPPAAGPAMKKMEKAFNDLANTIIPQDSCNFQRTSLEDVRQAALDIERELAGLEHYAATMGVVCNGTPFLPWVWAPITLILRIASEYVEAFEQIIKGYSRIAGSLKRFEILGKAFSDNPEFGFTLATFYEDILEFHGHAYKFVRRNGWRILFLTSWGRFQRRFESILENLERHGALIDQEANARNIAEAREMRHDLRSWREETLSNLSQQEDIQFEKQYQSILSWLKRDPSDQLAIMDTITTEISKYPDVYICIRDCAKVKAWLQRNTAASLLYLKIAKMPLLSHFCSYSYATSLAYDQMLRSLISQVVMGDKDLVAFVCNDYVFGNKQPSLHVLEELLENILTAGSSEPGQTEFKWIILDGLDECSPEHQSQMLRFTKRTIAKLSSSSSSGNTVCKFLIASQFSPEISRRMKKEHTLALSHERSLVEKAIQQYVEQRLQPLYQRFQSLELSEQQFQDMSQTVVRKADGMFLYARLVLDYLSTNVFMDEEEIKSSLDLLPARLTEFYETLLAQMLGFDVFDDGFNEHSRQLRTVKGIHGLHVYSTEFWTDYLLSASQLPGGLKEDSLLFARACTLAERLEAEDRQHKSCTTESVITSETEDINARLGCLERYPLLLKHVNASLNMRSLKALEFSYSENQLNATDVPPSTDHINRVLQAYQETVRFLLNQDDFPGHYLPAGCILVPEQHVDLKPKTYFENTNFPTLEDTLVSSPAVKAHH
ncbi:hypothetical protein GQ607_005990 [Colletotrichum asianum]|uniref:Nacht domain protein n=1 Tax=Colletotrichum asianum TaxID=702518 RepID=A0A8H3ZWE1_9PEZI|nr:hypothetical protein GQ607_005990 [Colletotrichum asianum]